MPFRPIPELDPPPTRGVRYLDEPIPEEQVAAAPRGLRYLEPAPTPGFRSVEHLIPADWKDPTVLGTAPQTDDPLWPFYAHHLREHIAWQKANPPQAVRLSRLQERALKFDAERATAARPQADLARIYTPPSTLPPLRDMSAFRGMSTSPFKRDRDLWKALNRGAKRRQHATAMARTGTGAMEYSVMRTAATFERAVFATNELFWRALGRGFTAVGLKVPAALEREIERQSHPEKYGVVSPVVSEAAAIRQADAMKAGTSARIMTAIQDSAADFTGLVLQMGVLRGLTTAASAGGAMLSEAEGVKLASHLGRVAGHAFVATPGTVKDRFQAAVYRVGYNVTPFIVNEIGLVNASAVLTDVMLNSFMTAPSYVRAWKAAVASESDNVLAEFAALAAPQFFMDVAMAWRTRGLPENQRKAAIDKYITKRAKSAADALKLPKGEMRDLIEGAQSAFVRAEMNAERQASSEEGAAEAERDLARIKSVLAQQAQERQEVAAEGAQEDLARIKSMLAVPETALKDRPDLATRRQREQAIKNAKAERAQVAPEQGATVAKSARVPPGLFAAKTAAPTTPAAPEAGRPATRTDRIADATLQIAALPKAQRPVLEKALARAKSDTQVRMVLARVEKARTEQRKSVRMTEKSLLKRSFELQQRAAKTGYEAGQQEQAALKADMVKVVKALPVLEQAPILSRLASARTKAQLVQVAKAIQEVRRQGTIRETHTSAALLRYSLQRQVTAARKGYYAGRLDLGAEHREIIEFAKAKLPADEFKMVAKIMERIAKTRRPSERKAVIKSVNNLVARYEQASAIGELKDAISVSRKVRLPRAVAIKVEVLLDAFNVKTPTEKTYQHYRSMLRAGRMDDVGEIPMRLIKKGLAAFRRRKLPNVREMDADAIRDVTRGIQAVVHQHELKTRLLFDRTNRTADQVVAQAAEEVRLRHGAKHEVEPGEYVAQGKQAGLARLAGPAQISLETRADALGGEQGAVHDVFVDGPVRAERATHAMFNSDRDWVAGVLGRLGLSDEELDDWNTLVWKVQLRNGVKLGLTKSERVTFLGLVSDADRRAEILRNKGGGVVFLGRRKRGPAIKIKAEDLRAIRDSATDMERAFVGAAAERIRGAWADRANEAWLAEYGVKIATRADHWPSERDSDARGKDPNTEMQNRRERMYTDAGIFKPRTGGDSPFVIRNIFDLLGRHSYVINNMAGKTRAMHDALRLLDSKQGKPFRDAVRAAQKYGDATLGRMRKAILAFGGMQRSETGPLETFIRGQIRRAHRGALGLKPHIMLYQPISYVLIHTEGVALGDMFSREVLLGDDAASGEEIRKHWPEGRARFEGSPHQLFTPGTGPTVEDALMGRANSRLDKLALGGIHWMDTKTITRIWRVAQREGRRQGLKGDELVAYTVDRASELVRRTQPTWDPLTISGLQIEARDNALVKIAATMFSSQRSKNFNISARAIDRFRQSEKTAADFGRLAEGLILPNLGSALMITAISGGIRHLYDWLAGAGDEDNEPEAIRLMQDVVDRVFGNWLVLGDIMSLSFRKVRAGAAGERTSFMRPRQTVIVSGVRDMAEALGLTAQAIGEAIRGDVYARRTKYAEKWEKKWKLDAIRAAERAANASGILLGLPLPGLMQVLRPHLPTHKKRK